MQIASHRLYESVLCHRKARALQRAIEREAPQCDIDALLEQMERVLEWEQNYRLIAGVIGVPGGDWVDGEADAGDEADYG